jgi:hypothetical protein
VWKDSIFLSEPEALKAGGRQSLQKTHRLFVDERKRRYAKVLPYEKTLLIWMEKLVLLIKKCSVSTLIFISAVASRISS